MDSGSSIIKANRKGTELQTLANVHMQPPGAQDLQYGFYADVSTVDSQIVYVTCEFTHESQWYPEESRHRFGYEIATMESDGSGVLRLTNNRYLEHFPVWSPNGGRIAFLRSTEAFGGRLHLYTMAPDGSDRRLVTQGPSGPPGIALPEDGLLLFPPVWSPDGKRLAFIGWKRDLFVHVGLGLLFTVREDGTELREVGVTASLPTWSPDSQLLAFSTFDEDVTSIHVARADGSARQTIWHREFAQDDPGGSAWEQAHAWTHAHAPVLHVAWSPTTSEIAFISDAVYAIQQDGSGLRRLVGRQLSGAVQAGWSADGGLLAVLTSCRGGYRITGHAGPYAGCSSSDYPSILIVMQPNGANLQILAKGDWGLTSVWNTPLTVEPADPRVCSQGVVVPRPEANRGLVLDCETLLQVRDTLVGGGEPLTWDGRTPIDQWHGIGVEGDGDNTPLRVRSLNLADYGLRGVLPPQIGKLTELHTIDLAGQPYWFSGNSLTGPIPADWGNLQNLKIMDLNGNHLSGPIPSELGGLSKLEVLALEYNQLGGQLPPEIGHLESLNTLLLANNNIYGGVPPGLGQLAAITHLDLSGNQLTGEIPPELGELARLQYLDLENNRLTGGVPLEFIGVRDDLEAKLLHNNLSGCIATGLPDVWLGATGLARCAKEEAMSS